MKVKSTSNWENNLCWINNLNGINLISSFHLMKERFKSLWRISKWLNMISIDELNKLRRYLNFQLMESDKFFQIDLNRNIWVNSLVHSKFNQIDWNCFIWWLNDLNDTNEIFLIFLNWNELKWFFIISIKIFK